MDGSFVVNGLALPPLLVRLIQTGQWKHPGDDVIRNVITFLNDPVDFLSSVRAMEWETIKPHNDPRLCDILRAVNGSDRVTDLPWLDVTKAVTVAVNREIGADVSIELDYRTSSHDPRVIASEWQRDGIVWREVALTFTEFATQIGLHRTGYSNGDS